MPLRTAAVTALFALVSAVTAAAPAGAREPGDSGGPAESAGILLTVSGSDRTWMRGVTLHCRPGPEGSHPRPAAACAALHAAAGDPDALPGRPLRCTDEYAPVTAAATGTHDGKEVDWTKTFRNACALHAAADPVFAF